MIIKKNSIILLLILTILNSIGLNSLFANNNTNLIITEVANHEPSDYEWIEIYNNSSNELIISNLIFREDNINHKTTVVQGSNVIKPFETFLIVNNYNKLITKYPELINDKTILDSSWSSLSNSGELLELILDEITLNQITYAANNSTNSTQLNLNNLEWINTLPSTPFYIPDFDTEPNNTDNSNDQNQSTDPTNEEDITYQEPNENNNSNTEDQSSSNNENTQNNDENNNIDNENNNSDQDQQNNTNNQSCQPTEIIKEVYTYKNIPNVLISEISFNDTSDWIEIYIDPRNEDFDLSNLYFFIDKKKLPLGLNYKINQANYIIAELDLVSTTEQVTLLYNDKELDTICWNNQNPTAQELVEETEIKNSNYWLLNCLDSQNIQKGHSYSRANLIPDTNTSNDFILTKNSTKGEPHKQIQNLPPTAKIKLQNTNASGYAPLSVNLDGSSSLDPENEKLNFEWDINNQKFFTANPSSIKFETPGEYTAILTVTDSEGLQSNASLLINVLEKEKTTSTTKSNSTTDKNTNVNLTSTLNTDYPNNPITLPYQEYNLEIYEFLANPAGTDTNNEWISIVNNSNESLNLKNCTLDDDEGGSKPYQLPNYNLSSKEIFTVTNDISKISLNNSNEKVRLFCNNELISEVEYDTIKEDEIVTNYPDNRTATSEDKQVITTNLKPLSSTKKTLDTVPEMNPSLVISEIFPNPKGTDSGNEWVEIHNPTSKDTKLNGWTIQINSKNHSLDDYTAKSKSYLLVKNITIPNSNTTIKLVNPHQNIQSEISFEKSYENQSYTLLDLDYYDWTEVISPEKANPIWLFISGIIESINQNNQEVIIQLDEYNAKPNTKITVTTTKENLLKMKPNQFIEAHVLNYENQNIIKNIDTLKELSTNTEKPFNKITIIIITFTTIAILSLTFVYKDKVKNIIMEIYNYLQ